MMWNAHLQGRIAPWRLVWSILFLMVALQPARPAAQEQPGMYIVGANDVLTITVHNQADLSRQYTVEADGAFTFPLIGRVPAVGFSVRAIEDDVRSRLAKGYLRDPQVTVSVETHRSQQVFVVGEVRSPGGLQLIGAMTLIEALARAGSITERAGPELMVVRPKAGAPLPDLSQLAQGAPGTNADIVRVNVQNLQAGALGQNIPLQAGDIIFVPRAETVFVSGQVHSSGEYVIRKGMTVRQVLSLAGGVTDRGSTRRIQIIRQVNGVETTISASQQDLVQADDTIVVRERLF
jgi:polysaccharide biosynthesis/export protein